MTSDCLSRLEEDGKQAGFDEEVLRDVSGVAFTGEFVPKVLTSTPPYLIVGFSCD